MYQVFITCKTAKKKTYPTLLPSFFVPKHGFISTGRSHRSFFFCSRFSRFVTFVSGYRGVLSQTVNSNSPEKSPTVSTHKIWKRKHTHREENLADEKKKKHAREKRKTGSCRKFKTKKFVDKNGQKVMWYIRTALNGTKSSPHFYLSLWTKL